NMKQREKSLRWSLRENIHVKRIYEKFKKGNLWCKITFDCKKDYEEAKIKLENSKENFEKLKLILEEVQQKTTNMKTQEKLAKSTKKEEGRAERERKAKKELKEISKQRGKKLFKA